jgi:hypothetical protein
MRVLPDECWFFEDPQTSQSRLKMNPCHCVEVIRVSPNPLIHLSRFEIVNIVRVRNREESILANSGNQATKDQPGGLTNC